MRENEELMHLHVGPGGEGEVRHVACDTFCLQSCNGLDQVALI